MNHDYQLACGAHVSPDSGRCAMEWVSYLAGEPHGDQPGCVSPVMRAFCIALNDGLGDEPRQRLRPYLARTIDTACDGLDAARSWMAMDWLIRTHTSIWLAAAGLEDPARRLCSLAALSDASQLSRAIAELELARDMAAGATVRPTVGWRVTARAARATAREAAWGTPAAAAWAAAGMGVPDSAADRARAAAGAVAARVAARIGRDAATTAKGRTAARAAAQAALAPTVSALEGSCLALLNRMLPTVALAVAVSPSEQSSRRIVSDRTLPTDG